jgi:hypothetical protein
MQDPIAVTLVEDASYKNLVAGAGGFVFGGASFFLADGTPFCPTQYFKTLGLLEPDDLFWLPVIVVNGLPTPLSFSDFWSKNSSQTHSPTESDLVGAHFDPLFNKSLGSWADPWLIKKGQSGDSLNPNTIPGRRPHPTKPGSTLYGLGAFGFMGDNPIFSNNGGMRLHYGDNNTPKLGICWSVGHTPNTIGVAADLSAYKNDMGTFYSQTADTKNVLYSDSGGVKISAYLALRRVSSVAHTGFMDEAERLSPVQGITDVDNYTDPNQTPAIIVAVEPK